MMKLIKVFLTPFLKLWSVYFALHLFLVLSINAIGISSLRGSFSEVILFVFFGFLLISPIYLNNKTNVFVKNISWMINSSRNRTQLVIYYHLELIVRIVLTALPFIIYYYTLSTFAKDDTSVDSFLPDNSLLLFLGTWASANFLGLSMGALNKNHQLRARKKNSFKKNLLYITLFLFGIYMGGVIIESPLAVEAFLIIMSFLFLVYVYSTHFVLFRTRTRKLISIIGSVILFIPSVSTLGTAFKNVESGVNPIENYFALGSLVSFADIKNRNEIFQSIEDKHKIKRFIEISESSEDLNTIAKINASNGVKLNHFLLIWTQRRLEVFELEDLISRLEGFSDKDQSQIIEARSLRGITGRFIIANEDFIDDLIASGSKVRQAVALELEATRKTKKELESFKNGLSLNLTDKELEAIE